ncbi:MAG TPA: polysaccharide biosynthesis/export family protein [Gemmataceae bacterium]|nr:polysaccharide biosynthesis/export family protein [Gemmataceae bacterium]
MARLCKLGALVGLLAVLTTGCSAVPGRGLTLFPEGHPMSDTAKALRSAYPTALPLPKELDKRPLPPYTVEPGDVLLIQPADLDSPVRLPGDQPVMPDGTINLGRYGELQVAGKTVPEIASTIRTFVEAQAKDPKERDPGPIVVRVVTRASKVYYVLGEVNAPGAFTLNGRETVLDGIIAAGGLTDKASRRNIILSRPTRPDGCRVVLPICYREIVQVGDTSTNYQLLPGDRIFVASRGFWDGLSHKKEECAPCGGLQRACPDGICGHDGALAPHPAPPIELLPPR